MPVANRELKPELETAFPPTTRGSHEGTEGGKGRRKMRAPSFGPSPLARRAMRLGLQHSEATNSSGELRDDDHVPQQRDPRPKHKTQTKRDD